MAAIITGYKHGYIQSRSLDKDVMKRLNFLLLKMMLRFAPTDSSYARRALHVVHSRTQGIQKTF
jgi:hypothetical protein